MTRPRAGAKAELRGSVSDIHPLPSILFLLPRSTSARRTSSHLQADCGLYEQWSKAQSTEEVPLSGKFLR